MKLEEIKQHIKDHKQLYTGIGVGVGIAAITAVIMRGRHAVLQGGAGGMKTTDTSPNVLDLAMGKRYSVLLGGAERSKTVDTSPRIRFFNFFAKTGDMVTTIHTGHRGHPGFVVRNLETGIEFPTQNAAAKMFDISPSQLSAHLNGKFDSTYGLHFERIHG